MGFIVPNLPLEEFGYSLSNAYIAVGNGTQYIQKETDDYGSSNAIMTGVFNIWKNYDARMNHKTHILSYTASTIVPMEQAVPYTVFYSYLISRFPNSSNVFP